MNRRFVLLSLITILLYAWPLYERLSPRASHAAKFIVNPPPPAREAAPYMADTFISRDMGLGMVHAATVCEMPDGGLAAVWYGGIWEGARDTAVFLSTRGAGASSWSPPGVVADAASSSKELRRYIKKVGNPVLFTGAGDRLWLVYVTTSFGGWAASSLNVKTSSDGGKTWTAARRLVLSPFLNISELVRNRPVRLTDGGFLIPIYHELIGKFPELLWLRPEENGNRLVYRKTRMEGGRRFIQPMVVPHGERSAAAFFRNCSDDRKVGRSLTSDGGMTWSRPKLLKLPNPDSAVGAVLLSDKRILLGFNDSVKYRSNLRLAVSNEAATEWARAATLEQEEGTEFSYPYLISDRNGRIHMVYTWRNRMIRHLEVNEAWVNAGLAAYMSLAEKGRDLVEAVFDALRDSPPGREPVLAEIMRRSALDAVAGVAEGEKRHVYRDALLSFYDARGHLGRLDACLAVAQGTGYPDKEALTRLTEAHEAVKTDLEALIKDYEWLAWGR